MNILFESKVLFLLCLKFQMIDHHFTQISDSTPDYTIDNISTYNSQLKTQNSLNYEVVVENSSNISNRADISSKYYASSEVPSSFAILVNFGIDGRRRMLYSSRDNEGDQCDTNQIYDPFIEQCRQLYCSAHFSLVDFKCVEDNYNSSDIIKPSVLFLDSSSDFVNITLKLQIKESITNFEKLNSISDWTRSHNTSFEDEFTSRFNNAFAMNLLINRIKNVTYVGSKGNNTFEVNFNLIEGNLTDNTVSNDKIVSVMSNTIRQDGLNLTLFGQQIKVLSIHTILPEYKAFCSDEWDIPLWYWNSEFTLLPNGSLTYLFVNETGRKYRPGQYLGNILYVQGTDQLSQSTPNKVNVSSNVVVCETQTLINESCPRILLQFDEYEWTNDGNALKTKSGQIHDHFELAPNRTVYICFIPDIVDQNSHHIYDLVESILSTVLIIISIAALTCVLVTYLKFQSLRSTIHGFMTINLSLCLEAMQIIFLTNQFMQTMLNCKILAILLHYLVLLSLSWTSVIAFDMHRTFGANKVLLRDKNSLYIRLRYWVIANSMAAIITLISFICDELNLIIAPNYGLLQASSTCWIRNSWATFIFFGSPLTLQILINFSLYLVTIYRVRNNLKFAISLRRIAVGRFPSDSSDSSNGSTATTSTTTLTTRPNQVLIFTRLGVLMGFTWIIALIIAFIPQQNFILLKALSYLFVICNTSQGLVLFIAFLCNAKVANMWRKQCICTH